MLTFVYKASRINHHSSAYWPNILYLGYHEVAKAPKYRGAIFQIEADEKGLALVDVKEASLKVYLMIDPECDKILETRFFTYGGPIFTALADTFCKKIQMATVEEACAITAESLELELRDTPDVRAIAEIKDWDTNFKAFAREHDKDFDGSAMEHDLTDLASKRNQELLKVLKQQKGVTAKNLKVQTAKGLNSYRGKPMYKVTVDVK